MTLVEPAAAPRATTHSGRRGSNRRALWLRLRARAGFRSSEGAPPPRSCVASRPENIDPERISAAEMRSLSLLCTLFFWAPLSSGGFTDRRVDCGLGMPECMPVFVGVRRASSGVSSVVPWSRRRDRPLFAVCYLPH